MNDYTQYSKQGSSVYFFVVMKILFLAKLSFYTYFLFFEPDLVYAYYTNMSASVVVGQVDFSGDLANQGGLTSARTLANPYSAIIVGEKLIVADSSNNRVLIYSTIPTTNNQTADVVIGQSNFSDKLPNRGSSANRNANTFNIPQYLHSDGTKLFVADSNNHRVLIFNTIPTSNNKSADVVVGQQDFTSGSANQGGTVAANTLNGPAGIWVDGKKLFIADSANHRVLIFNNIPTSNNASADLVIGQVDLTSNSANQGGAPAANTLWFSSGVIAHQGKLVIAELNTGGNGNKRLLVYNSIPTSNNAFADTVIFQPDFSSNSVNQGGSANANTIAGTRFPWVYNGRLFVPEDQVSGSNRVLVFNSIPSSNNAAADIVIGQPNFSSTTVNQGGPPAANTLNRPTGGFADSNRLVVADRINSRVLIYNNLLKPPSLSLNNDPEAGNNNLVRLKGTATVDELYKIHNVEFSINGGGYSGATASDGKFDESSEDYYFDFSPSSNQPRDGSGNLIEGYTVRVKSTNNNTNVTDRLFYFSPFELHNPVNNSSTTTNYPTFEFSVNKQRTSLKDALSKYQVKVKRGGSDSTANWTTLIDDIPIDFRRVKNDISNIQWNTWGHLDTNNGVYETEKMYAIYSDESSRIKVYSKINAISGTYQWKVVAVDKSGHNQETVSSNLYVQAYSPTPMTSYFPLAVLHISGLGNPYLNSYSYSSVKSTYHTLTANPTFYGIAWSNSRVTLNLTEQNCIADCTKTYSTITNLESRYGINVPRGDLSYGKQYSTKISVSLDDRYNELPHFTLIVRGLGVN